MIEAEAVKLANIFRLRRVPERVEPPINYVVYDIIMIIRQNNNNNEDDGYVF